MRLLVVEPNRRSHLFLSRWLKPCFSPRRVIFATSDDDGLAICTAAAGNNSPLVLVMPHSSALTMLYRAATPRSYIVATPPADALQAKLEALDDGADLILPKPWAPADLLATLRAAERRFFGHSNPVITRGPLMVDTNTRDVWYDGVLLPRFPPHCFSLIRIMACAPKGIAGLARIRKLLYDVPFPADHKFLRIPNLCRVLEDKLAKLGIPMFLKPVKTSYAFEPDGLMLQFDAKLS